MDLLELNAKYAGNDADISMRLDNSQAEKECADRMVCPSAILLGAVRYGDDPAPNESGVYFLIENGEVVYVGRATRIRKRLHAHKHWRERGDKQWSHYYAITGVSQRAAATLEDLYAQWLAPAYNLKCVEGSLGWWVRATLTKLGGPVCAELNELIYHPFDAEFDSQQLARLNAP